jgi:hypothetical protein
MNPTSPNAILAQGRMELRKHLAGKRITRNAAIKAKCYDCMGGFTDGKQDCQITACPLYPWMPYRQKQGLTST